MRQAVRKAVLQEGNSGNIFHGESRRIIFPKSDRSIYVAIDTLSEKKSLKLARLAPIDRTRLRPHSFVTKISFADSSAIRARATFLALRHDKLFFPSLSFFVRVLFLGAHVILARLGVTLGDGEGKNLTLWVRGRKGLIEHDQVRDDTWK